MEIPLYQVDAFAERPFEGNPAAVCPLESWLDDATLQAIALENHLSETAFLAPATPDTRVPLGAAGAAGDADWALRWFTPAREVDLCGHATLATAHVVLSRLAREREVARFATRSGVLAVTRRGGLGSSGAASGSSGAATGPSGDASGSPGERDARAPGRYAMDLPAKLAPEPMDASALGAALGERPVEAFTLRGYHLAVFEDPGLVRGLAPDLAKVAALGGTGVVVTARGGDPIAPGAEADFVSRFFAPAAGVPEDPVCGSAHCLLAPFWAERLGRGELVARQVSARGGTLVCRWPHAGDPSRVELEGAAVLVIEGRLYLAGRR